MAVFGTVILLNRFSCLIPAFDGAIFELRPHDICIDCGANVGNITNRFAERGAIVHAFEPDPRAFGVLKEKFKEHRNINIHNSAVSTENGVAKLYRAENASSDNLISTENSSLIENKMNMDKSNFIIVQEIDIIDFIKIL